MHHAPGKATKNRVLMLGPLTHQHINKALAIQRFSIAPAGYLCNIASSEVGKGWYDIYVAAKGIANTSRFYSSRPAGDEGNIETGVIAVPLLLGRIGYKPISIEIRLGTQVAEIVNMLSNRIPSRASLSMLGILTTELP